MKIIDVARQQKDLLNEGIAYIAVWQETTKNGKRSWNTEDIFPDGGVQNNEPVFGEEQKARLAEIAELDADAILLNGWLHAWIGSTDEPLTAAQIAEGIKKHYEKHNCLISGYLAHVDDEPSEATEPETVDTSEKNEDTATVTDDHGGEYGADGEYINGTGEAVCFPESGMSAADVPEMITIELPAANVKEDIFRALIESKATLIKAALGADGFGELPINFADGKVAFNWLRFGVDGETVQAWSAFLAAAVRFSKTAKRVTAKDAAVENEKFSFRTFLVKIGMNDITNKAHRRRLLRNLKGDAAFATAESKARWQAKHGKKTEVAGDEVSE
jgi:hypothetical protein